ncbi:MAG: tetratricopeptide repeat protein [Candidatus Dormibacteraeota bacterium]|nr:tetratricopeptide repeat protein [Candidatus Dormibacteraeota bacterium]
MAADQVKLSRREEEVAALVAEGLTNREIARQLFISERTVEGHVEHLLSKLGYRRRSQIAVWARDEARLEQPGNLPSVTTTFVGRSRELAEVGDLLARNRLVTILGAGGIGKTRIALEAAPRAAGREAAWFVDLSPVRSGERIWERVAAALGLRESDQEAPRQTVIGHLGRRGGLILLDNCEHIIDESAAVAEALLKGCPQIRILATSREPLGVYGEQTWRAPPMEHEEAVSLFTDRARLAAPSGQVSEEIVGELVSRLDGLPLAIELAAARVAVLSPKEILRRLQDVFPLLTGGPRTLVPRQQTLRATVDWSFDLLAGDQRRLFCRLSVFVGGFDLEAAEAVHGGPVLDLLAGLVSRSLVVAQPRQQATRYRLLEVLRQYGQARLQDSGEAEEMKRRHALHFLQLARRMDAGLRFGERGSWLPRIRLEQENLRAALDWARGMPGDLGLELATHLSRFWVQDGWPREGSTWMELMLDSGAGDRRLRATALHRAGELAFLQGDYETARVRLEASLALKEALGDQRGAGRRLNLLSIVATARGDFPKAESLAGRALEIAERLDDERGSAWARLSLGYAAFMSGERGAAEARFREAARIHRRTGDTLGIIFDLGGMIWLDLEKGEVEPARARIREGIEIMERDHLLAGQPGWMLGGLVLAAAEGRYHAALRLSGAIDATKRSGLQQMGAIRARYQSTVDRVRQAVGEPEATRLIAEGAAMEVEEVIHEIFPPEGGLNGETSASA